MTLGLSQGPEETFPRSCWAFKPKPEIAPVCGGWAQKTAPWAQMGDAQAEAHRDRQGRVEIEIDRDTDAAPGAERALLPAILV